MRRKLAEDEKASILKRPIYLDRHSYQAEFARLNYGYLEDLLKEGVIYQEGKTKHVCIVTRKYSMITVIFDLYPEFNKIRTVTQRSR